MKIFNQIVQLAFFFFSISCIQAQQNTVSYGVKAGVNLSTITGEEIFDRTKPKIGFHLGGILEVPLSDRFSLQPELLYSYQGSKFEREIEIFSETDLFVPTVKNTLKLSYLVVPVLGKYYFTDYFSFEFGPQLGILLSAKDKTEAIPELQQGEIEIDAKNAYESVDLGFKLGLGYKLDSGMFFQGAYTLGATMINKFEGPFDETNRNSLFQVSTGFVF